MACQACGIVTHVLRIEDDDPTEPYLICEDCSDRLRRHALHPLEWFNLAARHGWHKYLLHDSFYYEDGTAIQPDTEKYSVGDKLAPSLDEAAMSPERLLDYCITRWRLKEADFEALRAQSAKNLFAALKERAIRSNAQVYAVMLTICANVLGSRASAWVEEQYKRSIEDDLLFDWAEAAANCLPQQTGLEKTIEALAKYQRRELEERLSALSWFRSTSVLDWIEQNVPTANVAGCWGQLAALSNLNWERVEQWLAKDRPLSLVALDALDQFMHLPRHAPLVRELRPVLKGFPDRDTALRSLELQKLKDPAPRSVKNCENLIKNIEKLHISDEV